MKIVCDNCATKYSIADEKVRGNRLRLMRAISERCTRIAHFQLLA